MKERCTPSAYRRISRWEHEAVFEAAQRRLDRLPEAMKVRRRTVNMCSSRSIIGWRYTLPNWSLGQCEHGNELECTGL